MPAVDFPDELTAEPSGLDALREQYRDACMRGCNNNGGYVKRPSNIHTAFDTSGDPDNDYGMIGDGALDAIAITHDDLDGLAAASMYRYEHGDSVSLLYAGHGDGEKGIDILREVAARDPQAPIYVADISPEDADEWNRVIETLDSRVFIRDHHPKNSRVRATEYIYNREKCSAEIVLDADVESPPAHLKTLATAARTRDLWEDDRDSFERHGLLSILCEVGEREFVVNGLAERGTAVIDADIHHALQVLNYERHDRTDWMINEAPQDVRSVGDGRMRVIYGHPPDTSFLAHIAKETFNDDIVAVLMPFDGGNDEYSISIRPGERYAVADAVADHLGGGGHPQAANGSVELHSDSPRGRVVEAGAVLQHLFEAALDDAAAVSIR